MASYSIYLELEGVQGASTHAQHENWIRIRSLEWCVERKMNSEVGAGSNREQGEVRVSDIIMTKDIDSASPILFRESCIGRKGMNAKIVFETTGSGGEVRMEYNLENVLISSYRLEQKKSTVVGSKDSDLVETLGLSFTKCEMKYIPTASDNTTKSMIVSYYDLTTTRGG